jgi:hypothetical protein
MTNYNIYHFRGFKGYALLLCFLTVGLFLLAGLIIWGLGKIGVPTNGPASPLITIFFFFLASFLTVGQFIKIEGRIPKVYDTNSIALYAARNFTILFVGGFIITALISGLASGDVLKLFSVKTLSGFFAGFLGFLLVCYIMIYLNFLLVSRLRKPRHAVSQTYAS